MEVAWLRPFSQHEAFFPHPPWKTTVPDWLVLLGRLLGVFLEEAGLAASLNQRRIHRCASHDPLSKLHPIFSSSYFRDIQPSAALNVTLAGCAALRSCPNLAESWLPKNDHPKVRLLEDQHLTFSSPARLLVC